MGKPIYSRLASRPNVGKSFFWQSIGRKKELMFRDHPGVTKQVYAGAE